MDNLDKLGDFIMVTHVSSARARLFAPDLVGAVYRWSMVDPLGYNVIRRITSSNARLSQKHYDTFCSPAVVSSMAVQVTAFSAASRFASGIGYRFRTLLVWVPAAEVR